MENETLITRYLDGEQAMESELKHLNEILANDSNAADRLVNLALVETTLVEGRTPSRPTAKAAPRGHQKRGVNALHRRWIVAAIAACVVAMVFLLLPESRRQEAVGKTNEDNRHVVKSSNLKTSQYEFTPTPIPPDPVLVSSISRFYFPGFLHRKVIGESTDFHSVLSAIQTAYEDTKYWEKDAMIRNFSYTIEGEPGHKLSIPSAGLGDLAKSMPVELVMRLHAALAGYSMELEGAHLVFRATSEPEELRREVYTVKEEWRSKGASVEGRSRSTIFTNPKNGSENDLYLNRTHNFFENPFDVTEENMGIGHGIIKDVENQELEEFKWAANATNEHHSLIAEIYRSVRNNTVEISTTAVEFPGSASLKFEVFDDAGASEFLKSISEEIASDILFAPSIVTRLNQVGTVSVERPLEVPDPRGGEQWTGVKIGVVVDRVGTRLRLSGELDLRDLVSAEQTDDGSEGIFIGRAHFGVSLVPGASAVFPVVQVPGRGETVLMVSARIASVP